MYSRAKLYKLINSSCLFRTACGSSGSMSAQSKRVNKCILIAATMWQFLMLPICVIAMQFAYLKLISIQFFHFYCTFVGFQFQSPPTNKITLMDNFDFFIRSITKCNSTVDIIFCAHLSLANNHHDHFWTPLILHKDSMEIFYGVAYNLSNKIHIPRDIVL